MKKERKKFEDLSEERQAEIKARMDAGQREATERHKKRERHQQKMKIGRWFVVDNKVRIFSWPVGRYMVSAGCFDAGSFKRERDIRIAYAICSPKDVYSGRIARGYIGHRLMRGGKLWASDFMSPSILRSDGAVFSFFKNHFIRGILMKKEGIPRGLIRDFVAICEIEMRQNRSGWYQNDEDD